MSFFDVISTLTILILFGAPLFLILFLVFLSIRFLKRKILKILYKKFKVDDLQKTSKDKIEDNDSPYKVAQELNVDVNELVKENEKLKSELNKIQKQSILLDEYQVKIEEFEKANREKEEIINRLSANLAERENKIKALEATLKDKNFEINQLEERLRKLELENKSYKTIFNTITAILEAKYVKDQNKLDRIRKIEDFILNEFIPTLDELNIFSDEYKRLRHIEELIDQFKLTLLHGWNRNRLTISVIGKFSSGKSSFINSLIGEDLLATHVNPTTAVPTLITDCFKTYSTVYFIDNMHNLRMLDVEYFKNITYLNLKNFPLSQFIKYFLVPVKYQKINGINFIDTPGFSSNKKEDFLTAKNCVDIADIVFFIIDINDGTIGRDSLDLLSEIKKDIYIILNKADTKPPGEINAIKEHVLEVCNSLTNFKDVIIYSAKKDKSEKFKNNLIELIERLTVYEKKSVTIFDVAKSLCDEAIGILKEQYFKSNENSKKIERKITTVNRLIKKLNNLRMEVDL